MHINQWRKTIPGRQSAEELTFLYGIPKKKMPPKKREKRLGKIETKYKY